MEEDNISSLQQALVQRIWTAFCAPFPHLTPLRFCSPRRIHDYFQADTFGLLLPGRAKTDTETGSHIRWHSPISASEVIARFEFIESLKRTQDITREDGLEAFSNYISDMELRFWVGRTYKTFPLIACFEGEIVDSTTARHYFHLGGKWYCITLDIIAQLHQDFQEQLSTLLIPSDGKWSLPHPWPEKQNATQPRARKRARGNESEPSRMSESSVSESQDTEGNSHQKRDDIEGKYNLSYVNERDFVVGDKACPDFIELFDLLYLPPDKDILYLYQVKAGFDNHVRDAASQLVNAALRLHAALKTESDDLFQDFASELAKESPAASTEFEKKGGAVWLERTCRSFTKDKIIFVFAFANHTSTDRDLERELSLIKQIGKQEIEDICRDLTSLDPAEVVALLQRKKLLSSNNEVTSVLLRMVDSASREREFTDLLIQDGWNVENAMVLFRNLRQVVPTQYRSAIPRFSLLWAAKKVKALGFGFGITQIQYPEALPTLGALLPYASALPKAVPLAIEYYVGSRFKDPETGDDFLISRTRDGGVSVLHALLGKKLSVQGRFIWSLSQGKNDARCVFVEALRSVCQNASQEAEMITFIEQEVALLLEGLVSPEKCDPAVLNLKKSYQRFPGPSRALSGFITNRKKIERDFLKAMRDERQLFLEYFRNLRKPRFKKLDELIGILLEMKVNADSRDAYEEYIYTNTEELMESYEKQRKAIVAFVLKNARATSSDKKLVKAYRTIAEIDTHRQESLKALDSMDAIYERYLTCLLDPEYPYGRLELNIASHIFQKQVELYFPNGRSVTKEAFGPATNDADSRRIFFIPHPQGGAYFACEGAAALRHEGNSADIEINFDIGSLPYDLSPMMDDALIEIQLALMPSGTRVGLPYLPHACYINATLQFLFTITELPEWIRSAKLSLEELNHVHLLWKSGTAQTESMKKTLRAIRDEFMKGYPLEAKITQQDACDFLSFVLKHLRPGLRKVKTHWFIEGEAEGGEKIGNYHDKTEKYSFFSISPQDQSTFEGAITTHFGCEEQTVTNDDFISYTIGSEERRFQQCCRSLRIIGQPTYLFFHLKRFEFHPALGVARRLDNPIDFRNLDGVVTLPNAQGSFEIIAIVSHLGKESIDQGHYVTHVINSNKESGKQWLRCDNDRVVTQSLGEVAKEVKHNAYLVLVKRVPSAIDAMEIGED